MTIIRTRTLLGVTLTGVTVAVATLASQQDAPRRQRRGPQVQVVQTSGCVEHREDGPGSWWLTQAGEPETTRPGVFNRAQVDELEETGGGTEEFHLVGVADFLDAEGLLAFGDRAAFTSSDQVNATGQLAAGRRVLVKGLLIEAEDVRRINLMTVVGLDAGC